MGTKTAVFLGLVIVTISTMGFYSIGYLNTSASYMSVLLATIGDVDKYREDLGIKDGIVTVTNKSMPDIPKFTVTNRPTQSKSIVPYHQDVEQTPRRYLIALTQNKTGYGNNVQYRFFKNTVGQALLHNRTIVMVPFFNDGSSGWGFNIHSMRSFENTFDVKSLRKLLPVATLDEFRQNCNGTLKTAYQDPNRPTRNFNSSQYFFETLYDIRFPSMVEFFPPMPLLGSDTPCVAIFYSHTDKHCKLQVGVNASVQSIVDQHLLPAVRIRKKAQEVIQKVFNGKPYFAIHYRNKTGEVCMFSTRVTVECDELLEKNQQDAEKLIEPVYTLWKQGSYSSIYVAHPSWSERFTLMLRKRMPDVKIVNAEDILQMDIPGMDEYKNDNYYLSILEQEICYHSDLFIGWTLSYWDLTIMSQRQLINKESINFSELLTTYGRVEFHWGHKYEEMKEREKNKNDKNKDNK